MNVQIGKVRLEIQEGDICSFKGDAVVNAANDHLWMGTGVAGALKRKGGEVIESEAVARGPISVGGAVETTAGELSVRYVIHAAVMGQDLRTDAALIDQATRSSLEVADGLGLRSIALPAFGTGVGGLPLDLCARTMFRAVLQYLHSIGNSGLRQVVFVLYGQAAYEVFLAECARFFEQG